MIDVLAGNCNEVTFEQKGSTPDYYDDIKVKSNNEIHHYQIKGSFDSDSTITVKNFVTTGQTPDFYLVNYFLSWINIRNDFSENINFVHMYTSRKIAANDILWDFIKKINDRKTKLSDNLTSVFQFDKKIISHIKFKEVFQTIRDSGYTNNDIEQFLDHLIIETSQPWAAVNSESNNPVYNVLITKLEHLGLDKYPNKKNLADIFRKLLDISDRDSINKRIITLDLLLQELQIITNYGSIPQDIDFDEEKYIQTRDLQTIDSLISTSSGKIILVTGKPGVGKTWLLTKWRQVFQEQNPEFSPIWYYVFLRVTGDEYYEERIRYEQIIANFVDLISKHYPSLIPDHEKFSATEEKLKTLLEKLGEKAMSEGKIIPIIIDGLDHVSRIKEQKGLSKDEKDVLEFFRNFSIPKGICLIIGSQPGKHLKFIQKEFSISKICKISGFSESETTAFLNKFSFINNLQSEQIYKIHQKTGGIPILLTYLTNALQQNREFDIINSFPQTNGNVVNYYDHLWGTIENNGRQIARYFSLLEFAVDKKFLDKMYPFQERDGRSIESLLQYVLPVLYFDRNKKFSIFHDSFRMYILNKTNFSDQLKEKYCERIYKTLITKQRSLPLETFQYSIKYAYNAKDYDFIINLIDIDYTDNAIKNLYRKQDLRKNLNFAILAASKKGDLAKIVFFGFLRSYTLERYQYLSSGQFELILTKLFPKEIPRILLNKGSLNLSLVETLDILATSIKNGVHLPYNEIMAIWNNKSSIFEGKKLPEGTDVESYALVIGYLGGIERAIEFITINNFTPSKILSILHNLVPITKLSKLQKLQKSQTSNPESIQYLRILKILLLNKNNSISKLHDELEDLIVNKYLLTIPNNFELLIKANFSAQEIKPLMMIPSLPDFEYRNNNLKIDLQRFSDQITALAFCDERNDLLSLYAKIFQKRGTLLFNILDLTYNYSKLFGEIYSKRQYTFSDLLSSFEIFFTSGQHEDEHSYFTDGRLVEAFLGDLIKKIISLVIKFGSKKDKTELLKIISIFNKKYYKTFTPIEQGYIEVLNNSKAKWIKRSILSYVNPDPFYEDAQTTTDNLLDKAVLHIKLDEEHKARRFVDHAFDATLSYGYHKDGFLFEILDLVVSLVKFESKDKLSKFSDLLAFGELLNDITDGDETRYFINYVISEILKINTDAAFQVAKSYGVDSWRFSHAVEEIIQNRHDAAPEIRFYLGESLSYDSDSFRNRIEPIHDCIRSGDAHTAKILLLKLRSDLEMDFPTVKYEDTKDFNKLAIRLKVPILKLGSIRSQPISRYRERPLPTTLDGLLSAITERYGWSIGSPYNTYVRKLVKFYVKDKKTATHKISMNLAEHMMKHEWGNHGTLERVAKLLAESNDRKNLTRLYELTFDLCAQLFRKHKKTRKFSWLSKYRKKDEPSITSVKFLFEQLTSYDYEIQKRAFASVFELLLFKNSIVFDMVLEHIQNNYVNLHIRECLAAALDAYVHNSNVSNTEIIKCAKYLLKVNDRTMVLSGRSILTKLGGV